MVVTPNGKNGKTSDNLHDECAGSPTSALPERGMRNETQDSEEIVRLFGDRAGLSASWTECLLLNQLTCIHPSRLILGGAGAWLSSPPHQNVAGVQVRVTKALVKNRVPHQVV